MDLIVGLFDMLLRDVVRLLHHPFNPESRFFALYLVTSALAAYLIYRDAKRANAVGRFSVMGEMAAEERNFLGFLFPKRVWRHPSAWLDLRYFFFHQLIGHFLMVGLVVWASELAFGWTTGGHSLLDAPGSFGEGAFGGRMPEEGTGFGILAAAAYMFAIIGVIDLINYATHYAQHKVPLLWQFHKVHHSAEVMHPLSNFREHPVDNFAYKITVGLAYGAMWGVTVELFGYLPDLPALLGVPLIYFAFNLVAYNLRHSHIWLRWPGRWSMVFPSPAHHHVHHSRHPEHIDKNFAFVFPVWDVIFGTYYMPDDNRDVEFGVPPGEAEGLTSCWRLYAVPFRDAGRLVRGWFAGQTEPAHPDSVAGR